VFAIFNLLDGRLDQALPSVDAMMEGVSAGVPRPCVEIVRACLLSAPERPSPEDVAAVCQKAYDDTMPMDDSVNERIMSYCCMSIIYSIEECRIS
jgi:hypothetical protein